MKPLQWEGKKKKSEGSMEDQEVNWDIKVSKTKCDLNACLCHPLRMGGWTPAGISYVLGSGWVASRDGVEPRTG